MDIKEVQYLTSTSLSRDSGWAGQCVPGNWRERLFGGIFQNLWFYLCVHCFRFGEDTSISGINNAARSKSRGRALIWAIIFFSLAALTVQGIVAVFIRYSFSLKFWKSITLCFQYTGYRKVLTQSSVWP